MAHCRWCGAEIEWAITEANGRSIPMDLRPDPKGNLLTIGTTNADTKIVRVVGDLEVQGRDRDQLRMPHHATCRKNPRNKEK